MAGRGGKRPGAGRPKGSRNRRTLDVQERLDALGCDPVEGLARIAAEALADGQRSLAADCYKSLLPYTAPKLRASAVSMGDGDAPDIAKMLREARERVQELRKRHFGTETYDVDGRP